MEGVFQFQRCMNYLPRIMTFCTMLYLNGFIILLILRIYFNSVLRQHCEVWASQFPFLHHFKHTVPPSENCLYGHINWSLAQAQKQSFLGLSQSLISLRVGKGRPKAKFWFNVQKQSV